METPRRTIFFSPVLSDSGLSEIKTAIEVMAQKESEEINQTIRGKIKIKIKGEGEGEGAQKLAGTAPQRLFAIPFVSCIDVHLTKNSSATLDARPCFGEERMKLLLEECKLQGTKSKHRITSRSSPGQ